MGRKLWAGGAFSLCIFLLGIQATVAAVGTMAGTFDVTTDGAASYRIPITVPPGTAGIAPKLALRYSSQGGNGLLGVGWSLSGLSSITRCPATYAQDGFVDAVDFDENDRLCLDGIRLVPVSGAYGKSGTEYRTEIERFAKIRQEGGNLNSGAVTFKVWTKSGLIKEYGIRNNSAFDVAGKPYALLWSVDRILDTAGNYIDIRYAVDPGSFEHYVDRIDYTGNIQAGLPPYNSVRFEYQARPDVGSRYIIGGSEEIRSQLRLRKISTYANSSLVREYRLAYTLSDTSNQSLLEKLTECATSGGGLDCLPGATFEWTQANPSLIEKTRITAPFNLTNSEGRRNGTAVDINGDGRIDLVEARDNNRNTWLNRESLRPWLDDVEWRLDSTYALPGPLYKGDAGKSRAVLTDVNGDGLPDFVEGFSESDQRTYINTGAGWEASDAYRLPRRLYTGGKGRPEGVLQDINGDGLADLVVSRDRYVNETWLNIGPACGSVSCAWQRTPMYDLPQERMFYDSDGVNYSRGQLQDINGDGLPDYVLSYVRLVGSLLSPPSVEIVSKTFLNTRTGWRHAPDYASPAALNINQEAGWGRDKRRVGLSELVDVNGDGLVDVVCSARAFEQGIHCGPGSIRTGDFVRATYINTGNGFVNDSTYNLPVMLFDVLDNWPFNQLFGIENRLQTGLFLDLNGDGKADFARSHAEFSRQTYLNHAASDCSSAGCKWQSNAAYRLPFKLFDNKRKRGAVGQINFDGRVDFVVSAGGITNKTFVTDGVRADLLSSIAPGPAGAAVGTVYTTLLDPNHYTKGEAAYPEPSTGGSSIVVASSTRDGGSAGSTTLTYGYQDLRVNVLGRGLLGFRHFTAKNPDTRIQESTEFVQSFPYTGMATEKRTESLDHYGNATTLTRTINSAATKELGAGASTRYFPYIAATDQQFFDLTNNMAPLTSVRTETAYDDYGNVTRLTKQRFLGASPGADAHTSVTINQYTDDVSQWFLGRLTHSAVTKTNPDGSAATRETGYEYDAVTGLLTAEIVEPNDPELWLRTDYAYDAFGNQTDVTVSGADIDARTTVTTWDSRGQFKQTVTNPLGHAESHDYSPAHGGRTRLTGPNGLSTTWEYDGFGREIRQVAPGGTTVTTRYEVCGNSCLVGDGTFAIRKLGSDGSESLSVFDRFERKILAARRGYAGDWIDVLTEYDQRDRVRRETAPHYRGSVRHWTRYVYDEHDRLVRTDSPTDEGSSRGLVTRLEYDGLVVREIDATGKVSKKFKNAAGRTVRVVDALGGTTEFQYDPFGSRIRVSDPTGNVTTITYDALGRKTAMSDPDMGDWTYDYDALGNLKRQIDAKGQITRMLYDKLDRLVVRKEDPKEITVTLPCRFLDLLCILLGGNGGTETTTEWQQTSWTYDTRWVGKLTQETGPHGFERSYVYDGLGRLKDISTVIDDQTYTVSRRYDSQSRLRSLVYPSGFAIRHTYSASGYLDRIVDAATGVAYWQLDHRDAFGNIEMVTYGNGQSTVRDHDAARGHINAILTGNSLGTEVQSLSYEWDKVGNLVKRIDQNLNGLAEAFEYDELHRLTGSTLNQVDNLTVTYDAIGNVTSKSGIGGYRYGADGAGPHAVTEITGARPASYRYDANGNMIQGAGRTLTWTSFNKPATITKGQAHSEFQYGPDRARYKHIRDRQNDGRIDRTTIHYIGNLYERHFEGAGFEDKHYLRVDGEVVAIKINRSNGTQDTHYLHKDHLGSIAAITDDSGALIEQYAYGAFGKRRGLAWDADGDDSLLYLNMQVLDRGYTGHEHLDHVGLIHMDGRVYDPILGRFTSADPFVQFPESTQGLNRYTYVNNNPLSYTDPSGFGLSRYTKKLGSFFISPYLPQIDYAADHPRQTIAFGLTVLPGGAILGLQGFAAFAMATTQGFAAGMVAGRGDLRAGLLGAATAGTFYGVGSAFQSSVVQGWVGAPGELSYITAKTVVHGAVGGAASDWAGGSFTDGFLGAAAAQALSPKIEDWLGTGPDLRAARIGVAAVIGGTTAAIGGGKFANGAITAAFARAFNEEDANHRRRQKQNTKRPPVTLVGGIGGSAVVGVGVEGSAGVLLTPGGLNTFDLGFFFSTGKGAGFNLSSDAFFGASGGSVFNLMGNSLNVNLVGSEISFTVAIPIPSGGPTSTVGVGPAVPVGASLTRSDTGAISYRTLIRSTTDFMCDVSGNC